MRRLTKRSLRRVVVLVTAALLCLTLVAELGLRSAGVLDFPVYAVDDEIGYIPAPNQSGAFLNRNRWQLNERSMSSPPWASSGKKNLLLLGDSVVWGGNTMGQDEKLGPLLQVQLPDMQVWSVGAGSWSVLNEVAYLDRYPDVPREVDAIVWILNSEDFSANPSRWASDTTHPRAKPLSALWYVVAKWVIPKTGTSLTETASSDVSDISSNSAKKFQERLHELARTKRVLIVLYPNKLEAQAPSVRYLAFRQAVQSAMNNCCSWLEVREHAEWNAGLYRDTIHPTPNGNQALAELIGRASQ